MTDAKVAEIDGQKGLFLRMFLSHLDELTKRISTNLIFLHKQVGRYLKISAFVKCLGRITHFIFAKLQSYKSKIMYVNDS